MNTTEKKVLSTLPQLQEFGEMLLENGFDILIPVPASTYFHFGKGNDVGYCQSQKYRGISFSTVHKPCRECGTGFRINDDHGLGVVNPTIKDAEKAFIIAPNWATPSERAAVRKYKGLSDYQKNETILKYELIPATA